jgi:hypothetical protein
MSESESVSESESESESSNDSSVSLHSDSDESSSSDAVSLFSDSSEVQFMWEEEPGKQIQFEEKDTDIVSEHSFHKEQSKMDNDELYSNTVQEEQRKGDETRCEIEQSVCNENTDASNENEWFSHIDVLF